jgi:hypothetical protein
LRSPGRERPAVRAFFQVRLQNRQRLFGPAKFVVERKQADLGEEGVPEQAGLPEGWRPILFHDETGARSSLAPARGVGQRLFSAQVDGRVECGKWR